MNKEQAWEEYKECNFSAGVGMSLSSDEMKALESLSGKLKPDFIAGFDAALKEAEEEVVLLEKVELAGRNGGDLDALNAYRAVLMTLKLLKGLDRK